MERSKDELDDVIREALGSTDPEALGRLKEDSMAQLLTDTFRGRHRRLAIGGAVMNLMLFIAGVLSAVQLLRADDQRAVLIWAAAMLLCFGFVIAIKIWYWLEMNRLAITREVKRVELQVVRIAQMLSDRGAD